MTLVLVHGNPETDAIWEPLRAALGRADVVALSPPGFGAPVPAGWAATAVEYRAWLVGELEALVADGGPVDLFGHDWGGGHVAGVAATRPDLVRRWGIDIAGAFAPDYVWHDMAQVWQTPGAGEEAVAAMVGLPEADRAAFFEAAGMTPAAARSCSAACDDDMARCILALYRSAAQPAMVELGHALEAAERRPALVVDATEDHYTGGSARAHAVAARLGAEVVTFEGLGHWWMLQDPERTAAALGRFFD